MSQNKNLLQLHCYACSLEIERWDLSANPELKDLRIGGDGYVAFDKVSILDCSNNHKLEVLMANLSQMELQNLRHLIGAHETNYQKLNTYASQAVDPQIKQIFTKSAQDALNTKQKLMSFLNI